MNKSDLMEIMAERSKISFKEATAVVNVVFDSMKEALVNGDRIELRGFGSFVVKNYDTYSGRNPKTGEVIQVPVKRLPSFKVGKELKQRVNRINRKTNTSDE